MVRSEALIITDTPPLTPFLKTDLFADDFPVDRAARGRGLIPISRNTKVGAFDFGIVEKLPRRAVEHDLAAFDDIGVIGDAKGQPGILFDQKNRVPGLVQFPDYLDDLIAHDGRQPK